MIKTADLRVGLVQWQQGDGIGSQISTTLERLGHEAIPCAYDERLPEGLDVVLAYGPFGSLVPVVQQLLAYPPPQRPHFVLWMTEQFPNPDLPEWVRNWGGILRSRAERLAFRQPAEGEWHVAPHLNWVTTKAHRFRYYGDLFWLQRTGILSLLVIGSQWTVEYLRERGFDPMVGYYGFHPDLGADLQLERDVPVLWLGKMGTDRRGKLLQQLRADLKERGVEILVIDGVEHPYVFGKERTELLNRTKVVVNLLRAKWDNHSMRYYLASSNRALIVTEPTFRHIPFVPGEHIVEAPPEQMADAICYYLSHEEERRRIVDRAHQLVTTELTYENAVRRIFERLAIMQQGEMVR